MTNERHSAKVSEVWKHLSLLEAVGRLRPARYAETNAGSPSYPLVDDGERAFGVRGFVRWAVDDPVLGQTSYVARLVDEVRRGRYPGSPEWVIAELGAETGHVLCDIDPVSLGALRASAEDAGWPATVQIVDADGMATVAEAVTGGDPRRWFVFIDPFDHRAAIDDGPTAIEVALQLLDASVPFACWYGYNEAHRRFWLPELLAERTSAALWAGDILTVTADGSVHAGGDLGDATTPGTGSGMVFGHVGDELVGHLSRLGEQLEAGYRSATLPSGAPGGLAFSGRSW